MAEGKATNYPTPNFQRVEQLRAHEYVTEQIRRQIALGLISCGEALPPERELAKVFGVGRATVQHALRLLEAARLVETRRGRSGGTFVHGEKPLVGEERLRIGLLDLAIFRRLVSDLPVFFAERRWVSSLPRWWSSSS